MVPECRWIQFGRISVGASSALLNLALSGEVKLRKSQSSTSAGIKGTRLGSAQFRSVEMAPLEQIDGQFKHASLVPLE